MAKLLQSTASGEQHGLINVLTNSVPFDEFKHMKPEHKSSCEKEKKEDARIVKVEYMNSRGRHERLTKPYCRWAGDPIQMWHLIPGQKYDVPMGFVKEINEKKYKRQSGLLQIDGENVNKDGSPLEHDSEIESVHRLVPVAFL